MNSSFIGRKAELERLQGFLARAAAGQLQVAFIAGEAGVGKSSLADEFIRQHEQTDALLAVAVGQCNAQTGSGDPYLPFRQILTSLTTDPDGDKPAADTQEKGRAQLREFVRVSSQTLIQLGPDLIGIFVPGASLLARLPSLIATNSKLADKLADRVGPQKSKHTAADPSLDQEKIFEQYAAVLKALARNTVLLLVLDDLQWADSGSLNLLFHLARQLKDSRILLLGTYRPDDVALGRGGDRHPLESLLNEFKRYFGDIVLDLSSANSQEGRAFVDALIDSEPNHLDAAFRDKLFARTGGHALFTVELLRDLQERGSLVKDAGGCWVEAAVLDWSSLPARVEGAIGERVARLPQDLHELLSTASVVGYDFAAQVVARVQGAPERDTVKALSRELKKRYRLVLEQGESQVGQQPMSLFRFSHALIQQYLYNELGAAERRLLHGDIAGALEVLAGDSTGALALQLAHHHDEAGNLEKAVSYWIQAGDAALAAYAHNEAITAYDRALELTTRLQVEPLEIHKLYSRRGRALELNGQFQQALDNYASMLAAARRSGDRRMELDAQVATSTLYSTPTAVVDAARGRLLSEETLKLAEELGDQAVQSRVLWNLLLANLQDSNAAAAIEYGERSLSIARALELREQVAYTIGDLGWAYNVACRFDEAEQRLTEADALWRNLGNLPMLSNNLNAWLLNLLWSGRYEKALRMAEESISVSRASHNIWNEGWPHHVRGLIWFEYGEVDRALVELQDSVRLAREANTPVYVAWYGANLCAALASLGAVQKATEMFRAVRVPNQDVSMSPGRTSTLVSYALCEIASGQLDVAESTLGACQLTNSIWDHALRLAQCRLALARGSAAQALAIAAEAAGKDLDNGVGQLLPEALLLKGRAHQANGEAAEARDAFEAARLAAEAVGSRWLLWQSLAALAQVGSDPERAAAWRSQTQGIVQFIGDHISENELREAFLMSPAARA
ncbi:MAG TPA: AAA family ATPase, partial [Anaerolineales bacterium]|nr:AAA family ATPase [Anaerolineales bacterium]